MLLFIKKIPFHWFWKKFVCHSLQEEEIEVDDDEDFLFNLAYI
jgi:hypothetical protein